MTSLRLPKLAYYRTVLCTFLRFGTMTWPSIRFDISSKNVKKPLDIIWPQIERKCSEEYLAIILAVKRKLWAIFLPRFHLEKEQTPGGKLKTFYIGNLSLCLHDSGFLETLQSRYLSSWMEIVVSVNVSANYVYFWWLVASLAILIAVPVVFGRRWTSLAGVLQMPRVSNAFKVYTYKLLNKK